MADLSKLSNEDLEALNAGDLSKVSDEGLQILHEQAPETAPATREGAVSPDETPGIGTTLAGGAQVIGQHVLPHIMEHPVASSLAASYVPGLNRLPILNDIKTTRELAQNVVKNRLSPGSNPLTGSPNNPIGSPNNPIGGSGQAATAAEEEAAAHRTMLEGFKDYFNRYGNKFLDHAKAVTQAAEDFSPKAGQAVSNVAKTYGPMALRLGTIAAGMTPATLNSGDQERMDQIRKMQSQQNPQLPNALNSGFSQQLNKDLNR
jgi:hypothetical protein